MLVTCHEFVPQGKTVRGYSWDAISERNKDRRSCERTLTSPVVCGMEFTKFNEASIKSKVSVV